MPPRRFFVLLAALYASLALVAWVLGVVRPDLADRGAILIAVLSSVGFWIGAWVEPATGGRLACARCGQASLGGLGFCTACGVTAGASR